MMLSMSGDLQFFTDNYSSINIPRKTALLDSEGNLVKMLEDNDELIKRLEEYESA